MFLPADVIKQNGSAYQGGTVNSDYFPMGRFKPIGLSGCVLWLRADLGVTLDTGVSVWADQSGIGDANRNLVQATSSKQPTLNETDAAYNGQATLSFASASSQILTPSGSWGASYTTRTMCLVGNFDGMATTEFMTDGSSESTNVIWNNTGSDAAAMYAGTNIGAGTATSDPLAVVAVFDGASSSLYISALTSAATGDCGASAMGGITVGSNVSGSAFLNGKIAEVVAYDSALDGADVARVLQYFSRRYGISLGA